MGTKLRRVESLSTNLGPSSAQHNATKARFVARTNATKGVLVKAFTRAYARINDKPLACERRRSQRKVEEVRRETERRALKARRED
jgi:hypothetical protein